MADQTRTTSTRTVVDPINTALSEGALQHSTITWRAIFAGVVVSLIVYMILMSAGMAIGGANLKGVIEGDSASGLGIGAGIWLVLSILISIFSGAIATSRVSGQITHRVGAIQGLVVAGVFFALLFSQLGSAIGTMGRGLGNTVGAVGGALSDVAGNSQVQQVIDDRISDLNLRSSPEVIGRGVATRLLQGNEQSAMTYLSAQTGISRQEASTRITAIKADVSRVASDVGATAAQVLKIAGWTLFGALLLGAAAGYLGGLMGAKMNIRRPVSAADHKAVLHQRPATV